MHLWAGGRTVSLASFSSASSVQLSLLEWQLKKRKTKWKTLVFDQNLFATLSGHSWFCPPRAYEVRPLLSTAKIRGRAWADLPQTAFPHQNQVHKLSIGVGEQKVSARGRGGINFGNAVGWGGGKMWWTPFHLEALLCASASPMEPSGASHLSRINLRFRDLSVRKCPQFFRSDCVPTPPLSQSLLTFHPLFLQMFDMGYTKMNASPL